VKILLGILGFVVAQIGIWLAWISITSPWRVLEPAGWIGLLMIALGAWLMWGQISVRAWS